MPRNIRSAAIAVLIGLTVTTWPANAAPPEDSCAVLTADQITRAIGAPVGNGSYVTPTFKEDVHLDCPRENRNTEFSKPRDV